MASGFLLPDLCSGGYVQQTPNSEEEAEGDVSLTNQVRQTYFNYLYRMIDENASFINATDESIMQIARNIEITAVKKALRTENYRREMLQAIREVQDKTVMHTVLKGLCPKEGNNLNHLEVESFQSKKSDGFPENASNDKYKVYDSVCAEMEKIFQEEPEIPSSPEDVSLCPILWDSEYHIQKSLLSQQLNVISKFNPPKYLKLTDKLHRLFSVDFPDDSIRGTPEPFLEVQRHCKKRIAQMLKHYIRPYYILKYFDGIEYFKKFARGCVHRLTQATPHIGARAIFKGISNAFNSREVRTIREDNVKAAIECVVKHITNNYNSTRMTSRNHRH